MYTWELYYDWYNLHGDSRVKDALKNVLDEYKKKPFGNTRNRPIIFDYGHLYELLETVITDEKRVEYLRYGLADLLIGLLNINQTSTDDPDYFGTVAIENDDPIACTRTILQTPGFLHYLHKYETEFGTKVSPRFRPVKFFADYRVWNDVDDDGAPPNRGPVYFFDEIDTKFKIRAYFNFSHDDKKAVRNIKLTVKLLKPDGKYLNQNESPIPLTQFIQIPEKPFCESHQKPEWQPYVEFVVYRDGLTGQYKFYFCFTDDIGKIHYDWGIESPDAIKVAYGMKKFEYEGVVFVRIPENREERNNFKLKILPGRGGGYRGDIVILDHLGKIETRIPGFPRPIIFTTADTDTADETVTWCEFRTDEETDKWCDSTLVGPPVTRFECNPGQTYGILGGSTELEFCNDNPVVFSNAEDYYQGAGNGP